MPAHQEDFETGKRLNTSDSLNNEDAWYVGLLSMQISLKILTETIGLISIYLVPIDPFGRKWHLDFSKKIIDQQALKL